MSKWRFAFTKNCNHNYSSKGTKGNHKSYRHIAHSYSDLNPAFTSTQLFFNTMNVQIKNCYKITDTGLGTKTPSPKQKDVRPRPSQHSSIIIPSQTIEDVALSAAYMIADAESKSFLAAEAVKEAERVSKMAEDAEAVLHLIKEIYEHCSN